MAIPIEQFPQFWKKAQDRLAKNTAELIADATIEAGKELLERCPVRRGRLHVNFKISDNEGEAERYQERTAIDSKGAQRGGNYTIALAKMRAKRRAIEQALQAEKPIFLANSTPYLYLTRRKINYQRVAEKAFDDILKKDDKRDILLKGIGDPV